MTVNTSKTVVISSAIQGVIGVLVLFGVLALTAEEVGAIMTCVNLVMGALVAIFDPRIPWVGKTE